MSETNERIFLGIYAGHGEVWSDSSKEVLVKVILSQSDLLDLNNETINSLCEFPLPPSRYNLLHHLGNLAYIAIMFLLLLFLADLAKGRTIPSETGCWEDQHGHIADCDGGQGCISCTGNLGERWQTHEWRETACPTARSEKAWCTEYVPLEYLYLPLSELPDASSPPKLALEPASGV